MRSLGTLSSQMKETLSLSDGGEGLKFESSALEVQRSTFNVEGVRSGMAGLALCGSTKKKVSACEPTKFGRPQRFRQRKVYKS